MKTSDFDYELPAEQIAQQPLPQRDGGRLLLLHRAERAWADARVRQLPEFLRPGDLLVFNNTRVVPARLRAVRERSGGKVEVFLLPPERVVSEVRGPGAGRDPGTAGSARVVRRVLTRSGGRLEPGEYLALPEGVRARVLERRGLAGDLLAFEMPEGAVGVNGEPGLSPGQSAANRPGALPVAGDSSAGLAMASDSRVVVPSASDSRPVPPVAGDLPHPLPPRCEAEASFSSWLARHGEVPLPPYIRRAEGPSDSQDRERYQTLFASRDGAVAAPTAGLHFSPALLAGLEARGVRRGELTLHVGLGTFRTVKAERVEEHYVDPEPYLIPEALAGEVAAARAEGRRVVAVGTTVLRALESAWDEGLGGLRSGEGQASLFVYPPARFRVVDALLTNFHLPRSSLLMLVCAFAAPGGCDGVALVREAYRHAQRSGYRFFSYGDACLIA